MGHLLKQLYTGSGLLRRHNLSRRAETSGPPPCKQHIMLEDARNCSRSSHRLAGPWALRSLGFARSDNQPR